jgi:hypothetical protein
MAHLPLDCNYSLINLNLKIMKKVIYGLFVFGPMLALAQTQTGTTYVNSWITGIGTIIKDLIPIMLGLAVVYFFWGMIKFIMSAGDADKAKEGKGIMIWGVIAIAVMVALFGLVAWLGTIFGVGTGASTLTPPTISGL